MENHKFYQNKACRYFPCHKMENQEEFNCLFCYCPLYGLGEDCGGDFVYLENGIKSCINCAKPHGAGGYEHVMNRMKDVMELAKKK